jgi:hypothetical protein
MAPIHRAGGLVEEHPVPGTQAGWRLPAEMDPSWKSRPWPRRHWRPLLGLLLAGILVFAFVASFGSLFRLTVDLIAGGNGRITSVNFVTVNGATTLNIDAAAGVSGQAGIDLACDVVEPTLLRDGYANARFSLFDRAGDVLATDETACGDPAPTPSVNPAA